MAVAYGLSLPVIFGIASLGTEVGYWYYNHRQMQGAADAAAVAAAIDYYNTSGTTMAKQAALDAGALAGDQVDVYNPPTQGVAAGNGSAVEVVITRQINPMLARFIVDGPVTISTRAVAMADKVNEFCVLGLGQVKATVEFAGTTVLNMPHCGIASNSLLDTSMVANGTGTVTASYMHSAGGVSVSNNTTLTLSKGIHQYKSPIVDPYGEVPPPTVTGCDYENYAVTGETVTLSPATYCGGLKIGAHAVVALNPGVYVISGGELSIASDATVIGSGVTFFLTGSGTDYASVSILGGATVELSAPTDGTYMGLLFYQDRNAPSGKDNKFEGGSTTSFEGAIYIPNNDVRFSGGNTSKADCTQIIANQVIFIGNSEIGNNCKGKVKAAGVVRPLLVE